MNALIEIARYLLSVASMVIIVQGILSFLVAFNVINTSNEVVRAVWSGLNRLTEPLYRPIRRVMPDTGALDLSPLVVLVIIQVLMIVLSHAYDYSFAYR